METITIASKENKQIIDITDDINKIITKNKVKDAVCSLFITHTTAALTCADLDPGTDEDMLDAFEEIFPKLTYRHPHDPSHVGDHIMTSLIGSSLTLVIKNGKLLLGTWQRVVMVEFYGPRERKILINIIK